MNTQILDDLQTLGLDETATVNELKRRWRFLSSHTHPDRYATNSPEFERALAKQKALNNAKDRILKFIKERDRKLEEASLETENDSTKAATVGSEEHTRETYNTQKNENPQQKKVSPILETPSRKTEFNALQECLTLVAVFGCMFIGVLVAVIVSLMLPFLATTAPIILVMVMLITMAIAMLKLREWTQNMSTQIHGQE